MMRFERSSIRNVSMINPDPKHDERGYFMCTYDRNLFSSHGIDQDWVQENESYNEKSGTLRGLHLQTTPSAQGKLIRMLSGAAFFAFVDLRKGSPSFGAWDSTILTFENKKMLYVPRGLALGMYTLDDKSILYYKMDNFYDPDRTTEIAWNDTKLNINWPTNKPNTISERDKKAQSFAEFIKMFGAQDIQ